MNDLLHLLRQANLALAVVATFLLVYRLPEALSAVWSKRLFLALCLYPIATIIGTAQSLAKHAPVGVSTVGFTVAHVGLIAACIWWPEGPPPRRY